MKLWTIGLRRLYCAFVTGTVQLRPGALSMSLALFAGFVGLCALPGTIHAEESGDGQTASMDDRESGPFGGTSVYFNSGPFTTIQRVDGRIVTSYGPRDKSKNTLTNMSWLFELGVSSPRLERVPGQPRLNAFGGVVIPTNESGVIGSKIELSSEGEDRLTEDTKMQLEYQTSFRTGFGIEFEFDFLSTRLKVTPGAQYLYLGSRYAAQAESVRVFGDFGVPNEERGSSAKNALVQHFVGPSLRLATDRIRLNKWLQFDLYIEGALLFDVAGTREQSRVVDPDGETSIFTWQANEIAGLFNAGLRIDLP